ncbi:uncharacterized protein ASPGLDRAFT_35101 [Aspergillus glaucus CBS 516.65]|uniref:MACPF-like domain-containing protein n=1 Tax=Aspergillus glaucus CBS 516.65 TaxID=1160497 RepID=A0A1L9VL49_ASPGL|nr:hypothetical protein ASPGLDRAFT_35101 [Aspergillus glaucus CBS 516.65]OJJ84611.1 hypothetical protein ASPGLDRAFT_35101 [Aspergillus glaucus CBS 516.65]
MSDSKLPKFQIVLDSKDGAPFPSFPSSEVEGGDPSRITLALIRQKASISKKLKFTADDRNFVSDATTLEYYLSLTGESLDGNASKKDETGDKKGEAEKPASNTKIPVARVKLITSATMNKPKPHVEQSKLQEELQKMLGKLDGKDAAAVEDLKKLSDTVAKLAADSMDFATVPGTEQYPEPMDMTEQQWERVLVNNRAFHGYYAAPGKGALRKARKKAFELVPLSTNKETNENAADWLDPVPPVPPFYVYDDAKVVVTETLDAFQSSMARQGFSSLAVEANVSASRFGVAGSASAAYEEENSNASKEVKEKSVQKLEIAYKFPRAVVELDDFCLRLTPQCIADAKATTNAKEVDDFYRDYGNAFVTTFTVGGELNSSRTLTQGEQTSITTTKEKMKAAAALSISSPWASGGASFAKSNSKEETASEQELHQNLQLAWEARGGNTLLCTNPSQWASTVKDYRLWRLMDQQQVVTMQSLIKRINLGIADHLESPVEDNGSKERILDILRNILETSPPTSTATKIRNFYESDKFKVEEYNKLLDKDENPMDTKGSWNSLEIEEKCNVGLLALQKKIITID